MKVLLIHGSGHCEAHPDYYAPWRDAIDTNLRSRGSTDSIEYRGLLYDDVFLSCSDVGWAYDKAAAELLSDVGWQRASDELHDAFLPARDLHDDARWSVDMIVQFCLNMDLRKALNNLLAQTLDEFQPDVIAAHGLGTLLTYAFLRHDARGATLAAGATYLTFGTLISNGFVRSRLFPGPISMPAVKFWFNLYNREDPFFTAPISISDPAFQQINTESKAGADPIGTVEAPGYLNHSNTSTRVWTTLATANGARFFARARRVARLAQTVPRRRALLVGINRYPDPANRLEGCVNDAFLISAMLQERGFASENIHMVLDQSATAQGIRDRIQWLLEGTEDGMERVFFFSGHGALMPGYDFTGRTDHVDECLVPWDFAWTTETGITDHDLFPLYSDLPFRARFIAIFDCCYSEGVHRDPGNKVRGLALPDELRHRLLVWDAQEEMWRPRNLPPLNDGFGGTAEQKSSYMGENRATYRIGRGMKGRAISHRVYSRLPATERGPYLPVIIQACGSRFVSNEYLDGVTSYGAFTYAMVKNLRDRPGSTFEQLISRTAQSLANMGYRQNPQIIGPAAVVRRPISGGKRRGAGRV